MATVVLVMCVRLIEACHTDEPGAALSINNTNSNLFYTPQNCLYSKTLTNYLCKFGNMACCLEPLEDKIALLFERNPSALDCRPSFIYFTIIEWVYLMQPPFPLLLSLQDPFPCFYSLVFSAMKSYIFLSWPDGSVQALKKTCPYGDQNLVCVVCW